MAEQLGWLDTNIFVHALFLGDPHAERCRSILHALQDGHAEGWLDPVVVHEMTYVLSRLPQFPTRSAVREYIRSILAAPGIRADDREALVQAVAVWAADGRGFADAWLGALARRRSLPVCSVNRADFPGISNSFSSWPA